MKKTYISPALNVVAIGVTQIIANSITTLAGDAASEGLGRGDDNDAPGEADVRENFFEFEW